MLGRSSVLNPVQPKPVVKIDVKKWTTENRLARDRAGNRADFHVIQDETSYAFDLLAKYTKGMKDGELSYTKSLVDMGNSDFKAGAALCVYFEVQDGAVINKDQFVVEIRDQSSNIRCKGNVQLSAEKEAHGFGYHRI